MISTPPRPTTTAVARRGPTRSPSNGTDRIVRNSGIAKPSAVTATNGSTPKPYTDVTVPINPDAVRIACPRHRRVANAASPPCRIIIGTIAKKPTMLRNITISNTGKSAVSAFTTADPSVKTRRGAQHIDDRMPPRRPQIRGGEADR